MQQLFEGAWINTTLLDQIQIHHPEERPETLFKCWSNRKSYTIANLRKILEIMGHEKLLSLIHSDIENSRQKKKESKVKYKNE